MVAKTGATNTPGSEAVTWKAKTGMQEATLDHVLVFPPDLRVTSGRTLWLEDC
jgi:hypothetical protein